MGIISNFSKEIVMAKGQGTRRQKDIARMLKERREGQKHKLKAWQQRGKAKSSIASPHQ